MSALKLILMLHDDSRCTLSQHVAAAVRLCYMQ